MSAGPYAVPRHPAPTDLDLAGTELDWRGTASLQAAEAGRYPDRGLLTRALARRLDVDPSRVLSTAGSDDALERSFRLLLAPGTEALLATPTFEMLPRFAQWAGASVVEVPWPSGHFPVEAFLAQVTPRTRVIAVVSPNNPTGLVASTDAVAALVAGAPEATVIVDLAYVEFADRDPTPELLSLPRVLVTRTFSKAWGLPGLRVGYVAGPAELVGRLRDTTPPYPVAGPSLAAALDALTNDSERVVRVVRDVRASRAALTATLTTLGVATVPSQGNFVCVDDGRAEWLRDGLAGLGIATRWCAGADRPRLRITVPLEAAQQTRLDAALRTVLRPEALLFDMDGVLVDVSASYRAAIVGTAARYGVAVPSGAVQEVKRRGNANDDWVLTARLLADAGHPVALAEVTAVFESLYQGGDGTPGLRERERPLVTRALLERLAARLPLGVVTGRPRADAHRFLEREGIADLFRVVVTRDDGPPKPDPFPVCEALGCLGVARAWMVGDTPDDARAARTASVLPLGIIAPGDDPVATGAALLAAGAGRNLASLDDLLELLP